MKKRAILAAILCLCVFLSACGVETPATAQSPTSENAPAQTAPAVSAPSTRTVTDSAGRTVEIPTNPKSIAGLDPFAGQVIIMLGYGDKMTSAVNGVQRDLLLQEMCPALANAATVKSSGSINAEALLSLKTDLIFVKGETFTDTAEQAKIDALHIPYVIIEYNSMEEQMATMELIGEALGASDEAKTYCDYYRATIEKVKSIAASVPDAEKPRLFHSINEAVRTDGSESLGADWIGVTGVKNVSLGQDLTVKGEDVYATLEQIFLWNPDLIICNESGVNDYILSDSKWTGLSAVRGKKVYQIPIGVSRWGHPNSLETPLAMLWLADLIYPSYTAGKIDLKAEMKNFYKTFYEYDAGDETIAAILSGKGIRSASTAMPGTPKDK